jgi:uncharacterized coiled-coil protein SlyX
MQNLEKRIAALEVRRGSGLESLTDDEIDARIAALNERIAVEEAAQVADPAEATNAKP